MGSFASKPKGGGAGGVTEADRAVLSLKTQRKKLQDYQKRTEASVEREAGAVREWVRSGNKPRAMLALKKKRVQEEALERAHAWILKIEQQLVELETAQRQAAVVESLKVGQAAMAALQKELKLDDIDKLLDDSEASKAHMQEVQAMLDAQLSAEDEAQVLEELEQLEAELGLLEEPAKVPDAVEAVKAGMPSVPTHTPTLPAKEQEQEEEDEEPGHEREEGKVKEDPVAA